MSHNITRFGFYKTALVCLLTTLLPLVSISAESKPSNPADEICESTNCFFKTINFANEIFSLQGTDRYRYWGFSLYEIAYYQAAKSLDPKVSAKSELLVIKYLRDFKKDTLTEAGDKIIKKNPAYSAATYDLKLAEFQKLYTDIKEGESYEILLNPTGKLSLYKNQNFVGSISDYHLGEFYLGIWLSKQYGASADLAEALRGQP